MKDDTEEMLYIKKMELEELKAPEDFEHRLRGALSGRKRKRFNRMAAAAVLVAVLVLTYSFDGIAYYGKKLLGYDDVAFGSIRQLNEEGMGQEINKSYTFSDGTEVTLNGVMFDEKELVAFYKIEDKSGELETRSLNLSFKGLKPMGYHMGGGSGMTIDEHTQVWTMTFDPPAFYEKWMTFDMALSVNGKYENGGIKFTLDRSKAMKHIVKWDIGKEITIGDVKIDFDTITASRLSTVVEGKLESADTSSNRTLEQRVYGTPGLSVEFDVIANGKKLQSVSGNKHTSGEGISFSSTSDGLPAGTNSLEISNIRLVDRRMVDRNIALAPETNNLRLTDDLLVKKVYFEGENTCVTVESKGMPVIGLFIDGKQADGIEPLPPSDSESSGQAIERVYKFKGRGDNMTLAVKTLNYTENSNSSIKIPVD